MSGALIWVMQVLLSRYGVPTTRPCDDRAMTTRPRGADDHAETTTRATPPRRGWRGRRRGQGSGSGEIAGTERVRAVAGSHGSNNHLVRNQ